MDSIRSGFDDVIRNGPIAHEAVRGIKFVLHHFVPHEDPAHRGLAQLMPATRRSMLGAMLIADPVLARAYTWYRSQVPPRPDRSSIKRAFQQKGEIIECRAEGHYCDHAGRNSRL